MATSPSVSFDVDMGNKPLAEDAAKSPVQLYVQLSIATSLRHVVKRVT
jgi:hypothetical protein